MSVIGIDELEEKKLTSDRLASEENETGLHSLKISYQITYNPIINYLYMP